MTRAWRLLRRLRLTVYVRGHGEHSLGLGYHLRTVTANPWVHGGENGLLMLEAWIAHEEWNDSANDPRRGR